MAQQKEIPFEYHEDKLGVKVKFLTTDRCCDDSLKLISYNALYKRMKSSQTWTGANTFTQTIYIAAGTLAGHAVNLGQLNNILDDYATENWVTQQINQISLTPEPKGDKPAHSWSGTQLRFENPNGTWGAYVNLKGDDGIDGTDGKTILSGTANPNGATGTIGDWYLNRTTWTMFEKTGTTT